MTRGRIKTWLRRSLLLASALALLVLLALAVLELRLPGPAGQSLGVAYTTLRTEVRDLLSPTPPGLGDFRNRGPNVVVILLDCYRHDYLDGASPRLAALAREAWHYQRHYASASWTKPSSASLFTGLVPRRHWITRGEGFKLPQEALTLAEWMKKWRFRTAGFVQGIHLTRLQEFDQGFDHYVDSGRRGSKNLLYQFFSWVERDRPVRFFAYLHFPGTHDSYYYDNDLRGLLEAPGYPGEVDFSNIEYKFEVADGERRLSEAELAHLRATARAKARRVDRQAVGEFLDRFLASELAENTLLIITSDHGDGFGEHDLVSHGYTVYNEEIHVPLVVRYPPPFAAERGFATSGVSRCPSSTVDLFPTVIDYAGLPLPEGLDGVSLVPGEGPVPLEPEGEPCPRPVISEMAGGGRISSAAIIWGDLKLIADYDEIGRFELYDVVADPTEQHDLANERPQDVERLRSMLERRLNADGSSLADWSEIRSEPISEELREQMRALGYID